MNDQVIYVHQKTFWVVFIIFMNALNRKTWYQYISTMNSYFRVIIIVTGMPWLYDVYRTCHIFKQSWLNTTHQVKEIGPKSTHQEIARPYTAGYLINTVEPNRPQKNPKPKYLARNLSIGERRFVLYLILIWTYCRHLLNSQANNTLFKAHLLGKLLEKQAEI